jgi:hypothetical protein
MCFQLLSGCSRLCTYPLLLSPFTVFLTICPTFSFQLLSRQFLEPKAGSSDFLVGAHGRAPLRENRGNASPISGCLLTPCYLLLMNDIFFYPAVCQKLEARSQQRLFPAGFSQLLARSSQLLLPAVWLFNWLLTNLLNFYTRLFNLQLVACSFLWLFSRARGSKLAASSSGCLAVQLAAH